MRLILNVVIALLAIALVWHIVAWGFKAGFYVLLSLLALAVLGAVLAARPR